jgi:riboflavin kinase/FMN adenylyltransferase
MNFRQRLARVAPDGETVVTIGVFDGVHQGHRHLLGRLVVAAGTKYIPTVLTFSNHPITVLRSDVSVKAITTPEEKARLLREIGVELVVSLEFTLELAQVSAADFSSLLVKSLNMKGLVLGPDTALGHNREGDLEFMTKQGKDLGFWVESVTPLAMNGQPIKSRNIRLAVSQGDLAACNRFLGRTFSLRGEVVSGDRRGRELGFPTANLTLPVESLVPGDGIYATWAVIEGQRHLSATSIGIRPTFGLSERMVEVHVLDFDGDLYGKEIGVEFVDKIRDQQKFTDVNELIVQMDRDVAQARLTLARDHGSAVA